jgi:hypothetical protein
LAQPPPLEPVNQNVSERHLGRYLALRTEHPLRWTDLNDRFHRLVVQFAVEAGRPAGRPFSHIVIATSGRTSIRSSSTSKPVRHTIFSG